MPASSQRNEFPDPFRQQKKIYRGAKLTWGEEFSSSSRALLHVQTAAAPCVDAETADVHRNLPLARVTLTQRHPRLGILGGFGTILGFFFSDV